jgi:hypothetical protein
MYLNRLSTKADYAARMARSAAVLAAGLKSRSYATLEEMAIFLDNADTGGTKQDCGGRCGQAQSAADNKTTYFTRSPPVRRT